MEIAEIIDFEHAQKGTRPFRCKFEACTKAFGRRSDLVRHQRIHNNDRPFKCEEFKCGRSFIQRSALTVHMRTHTGERPHVCEHPLCSKRFSDSSSLARHRRTHTGKKPYRCSANNCNKHFVRKTTLIRHMKQDHPCGSNSNNRIQWSPFIEERSHSMEITTSGTSTSTSSRSSSCSSPTLSCSSSPDVLHQIQQEQLLNRRQVTSPPAPPQPYLTPLLPHLSCNTIVNIITPLSLPWILESSSPVPRSQRQQQQHQHPLCVSGKEYFQNRLDHE